MTAPPVTSVRRAPVGFSSVRFGLRFAKLVISQGLKQVSKERADWDAALITRQDRRLMVSAHHELIRGGPSMPGLVIFLAVLSINFLAMVCGTRSTRAGRSNTDHEPRHAHCRSVPQRDC